MANKAAYLPAIGSKLEVKDAPLEKPGPNEVLIRNHAVAVNPLDIGQQDIGVLVETWPYVCDAVCLLLRLLTATDPRDGHGRCRSRSRRERNATQEGRSSSSVRTPSFRLIHTRAMANTSCAESPAKLAPKIPPWVPSRTTQSPRM